MVKQHMPKKVNAMGKILEILVFSKEPLNLHQIEKAAGLKHATAHKVLKKILKIKLVKPVKTSKFRTGLTSTFYVITWQGLLVALMNPEIRKRIDEIAQAHPDMSIIFKKWSLFEPVKNHIITLIEAAGKSLARITMAIPEQIRPFFMQSEEEIKGYFEHTVLGIGFMGVWPQMKSKIEFDYEVMWRICKQDSELSEVIERLLDSNEKESQKEIENTRKAKQFWRSL
jgi:DNA-binding transcriptional regulator GbsR (MarR family)